MPSIQDTGITDGLTLLRKLRESGTPERAWKLGLPVLHADPLADAEAVYEAIAADENVQPATLAKARSLIDTGELPVPPSLIDPLDEIAALRGDA